MGENQSESDDAPISDEAELWRRIPFVHWIVAETVSGARRVASAAFDDNEMSVVVASACAGDKTSLLKDHEEYGVACFTAGEVRSLGGEVVWAYDERVPGHAHVSGFGGSRARKMRRALAKLCRVDPEPT